MIVFESDFNVAEKLAAKCGAKRGEIFLKKFPDGECYARLMSDVRGEDCVLVKSIYNNEEFVKTLLILDAIKRAGPKSITLIAPYLVYMRQDKIFMPGEALSAEVVLKILSEYASRICLINSHIFRTEGEFAYSGIKIYNIDAFPEIVKYFRKLHDPKIIAPDKGALGLAERCGKILGCEINYLEKERDRVSGKVMIKSRDLKIEGKDVIIIDDMISSGGTMIEALKIIKAQKPASINLACVHGIFCDEQNFQTLSSLADEILATNSIPNKAAKVDLSGLIAEKVAELSFDKTLEGDGR
jgi:ribose-phosphate pyrophosphokinase